MLNIINVKYNKSMLNIINDTYKYRRIKLYFLCWLLLFHRLKYLWHCSVIAPNYIL